MLRTRWRRASASASSGATGEVERESGGDGCGDCHGDSDGDIIAGESQLQRVRQQVTFERKRKRKKEKRERDRREENGLHTYQSRGSRPIPPAPNALAATGQLQHNHPHRIQKT